VKVRATAAFRPSRADVAVMFGEGAQIDSRAISIGAARQLHASLGEALRLAEHAHEPRRAVEARS
jgi:hypothetical protein